jgi:alkylation response protein AidB-like acyl-CoA dehydrogenase
MSFSFTDEQEEFRGVLRRFFENKSPTTEVRRLMETNEGFDPVVWRSLSDDLGLPGVHISEDYGGQGFGFVELGIVMEEMGRALLCAPYFSSSVLAASAISNTGTHGQKLSLLPDLCAGRRLASLAYVEPDGDWSPTAIKTSAVASAGGFKLTGNKSFVVDGMSAEQLVVAARTPGTTGSEGLALYLVDTSSSEVTRNALTVIDPTRKLASVEFTGASAERLGESGDDAQAIALTLRQACVALAAESAGGAQAMLDSAVAYTLTRVQFGRLIGSFQAIKHQCADLLLDVELAKSGAYYAAGAATEHSTDFGSAASLAKAVTSDTFMRAAATCIQLHGGIGFTWEQDTHLWYKRAKSSEVFLGTPDYHRELMLREILLTEEEVSP